MDRPNSNCYWVTPGRLLAGEYPRDLGLAESRDKLAAYLAAGVSCFIDLTEEGELEPYAELLASAQSATGREVSHHRFPIRDKSVPISAAQMCAILTTIRDAIDTGHVVYVHCWGGTGRTGTAVACHLVELGMAPAAALDWVNERWQSVAKVDRHPRSPETDEQRQWVLHWSPSAS